MEKALIQTTIQQVMAQKEINTILNKFGWVKYDERMGDIIYKHPNNHKDGEMDGFWETKIFVDADNTDHLIIASISSIAGEEGVLFNGSLITEDKENEVLTILKQTGQPHG